MYNLRLALISMRRNPVLTGLMVLAIAVGIGASMTTLTVLQLLSADPLPGRSSRIFYPQVDPAIGPAYHHLQPYDKLDYRSAIDLWTAHRADRQTLLVDSQVKVRAPDVDRPPLMKTMLSATSDFFPMFDVPFQYGSGWSANDDAKRARVAVISAKLNDELYGGADSVGRTLTLRGANVRIVGVLKPWRPSPLFYDVAGGRFSDGDTADFYRRPEDVMTPFFAGLEINDGYFQPFTCWRAPDNLGHLQDSPCVWLALWVQLDTLTKVDAYRQFLANYAAQQKALGRFDSTDDTRLRDLMGWLDFNGVVPSDVRLQNWLAFAFLAICLSNTVCLLLAKFLRRGSEIALRRALGATRASIFWQYLVESGLIGFLGGVGGWLLTLLGLWLVRQQQTPYADLAQLALPMFLATFVLSIAVSLLAGLLPALRACRIAPALQLKAI
jgi:putative ABC transport system permease protein